MDSIKSDKHRELMSQALVNDVYPNSYLVPQLMNTFISLISFVSTLLELLRAGYIVMVKVKSYLHMLASCSMMCDYM